MGPDFLGETNIDLIMGEESSMLSSGSTIEAQYDSTIFDELATMSESIDPILQNADSLLKNINKLFASTVKASDITLNGLVNDIDQLVRTYDVLGQKTSIMLDGKRRTNRPSFSKPQR